MHEAPTLSSFSAYCFTVNYIVGVGFLSMPNAFVKAGLLLSFFMLAFGSFVLLCTAWWIVESIARYHAIKKKNMGVTTQHTAVNSLADDQLFLFADDMTDVSDMLGYLTYPWVKLLFSFALGVFICTAMWSNLVVFSSTMVNLVPIPGLTMGLNCGLGDSVSASSCSSGYIVYSILFILITVPLSFMDLSEQKNIQMFLTGFRFVAMCLIFISISLAMSFSPYTNNVVEGPPYTSDYSNFNFSHIGVIFPVAVFAQLFHHSIPFLILPMKNKVNSKYVFFASILTTFTVYTVMSLLAGSYFGSSTQEIVSLNWVKYSGLSFYGFNNGNAFTKIISIIILMFPPLDVISVFPLNLIAVSNSIFVNLPAKITKNNTDYRIKLLSRILVAVPTILLGIFIKNFSLIIEISGTCAFFVAIIGPALAYICTDRLSIQYFGRSKTPYSTIFSQKYLAWAVLIFGIVGFIYETIDVILRLI